MAQKKNINFVATKEFMGRSKLKVGREKAEFFTKSKRVMAKVPLSIQAKIKETLLKKYSLKGLQEIYDYLIVSGIVYFNKDILSIVEEGIPFYRERDKQANLARLGKCESPVYPKYHPTNFYMYPKDFKTLSDYLIEKNYHRQWVVEILFQAFVDEREEVVKLFKRAQDLDVRKRKKQVARLAEDKWIVVLPRDEGRAILNQLTSNYDNQIFSTVIQGEIDKFIETNNIVDDDDEIDIELQKKLNSIATARGTKLINLTVPREEND